jgi:hypothetical protein
MRMIPVNVIIELDVCARDFAEAVAAVRRGLAEGRYVHDAKICLAGSGATAMKGASK